MKWIFGSSIGVFILLGAIIAAALAIHRDEGPPEDKDLRDTAPVLPEEENSIHYLSLAQEQVQWAIGSEEQEQIDDALNGDGWDSDRFPELLKANRGVLDLVDKAMHCSRALCPPADVATHSITLKFSTLSKLLFLRRKELERAGQDHEALELGRALVQLGHRIQDSHGPLTAYFVGNGFKSQGLLLIRRLLRSAKLTRSELAGLLPSLAEARDSGEVLSACYRVEYQHSARMTERLLAGELKEYRLAWWQRAFLFRPNATLRLLAESTREFIANSKKHYFEMDLPRLDAYKPPSLKEILIGGNFQGQATHHLILGALVLAIKTKCHVNVKVDAIRVLVALRCRQLEMGKLPETLDELVPAYFDAIPIDDYDGRPLRYSAKGRMVYSVGPSLMERAEDDRSGVEGDDHFSIDF